LVPVDDLSGGGGGGGGDGCVDVRERQIVLNDVGRDSELHHHWTSTHHGVKTKTPPGQPLSESEPTQLL